MEAATPQALADLLQSSGRYTNGTPWPASRQMDNGRGDGTTTRCVQELIRNIQTCAANSQTSMRAANFQTLYTVTSRPRRALPTSRPNYYLSRPAPTTHDANFQTTMYAANVQTLYIRPCLLYITPGPRA